jgi:hypothetical protein
VIEYVNIYSVGSPGEPHKSAAQAHRGSLDRYMQVASIWLRVEQRWNGHWLRPPVGMSSYETSHFWRLPSGAHYASNIDTHYAMAMTLEPRA